MSSNLSIQEEIIVYMRGVLVRVGPSAVSAAKDVSAIDLNESHATDCVFLFGDAVAGLCLGVVHPTMIGRIDHQHRVAVG